MTHLTRIIGYSTLALLAGCSSLTPTSNYNPNTLNIPGVYDIASMSFEQLNSAIDVAYLDGQLSAEEARKARSRLAKGKLTSM